MDYIRAIDEIFNQFNDTRFSIRFWNGKEHHYGSGDSNVFTLIIKDPLTARCLLTQGSIGFGEAYMEERLIIEGDLEAYLKLRHKFKKKKNSLYLTLATLWASINIPNSRKKQIAHHYDIGNDFFKMFLDSDTMSYSSGHYEYESEPLADAQKNKLKLICGWLSLPVGAQVLDLGSGWGGFAKYAAKNYGWNIKGYTLSNEQLGFCNQLVKKNNLSNLVSFEYHDMITELPKFEFDGIVVIESIEHVGKKNLPDFFHNLKRSLKNGSPLVIQSTVRYKPHSVDRWTLKYIFPGGYLPSKEELIGLAIQAGFTVEKAQDDNYINTITDWIKNFEANQTSIEKMFGQSFYRMWKLWLYGTKVSFEMGSIGLFRMHLKRLL
jgi:cyclopropane-fatty-acyl-phospholipid synthase